MSIFEGMPEAEYFAIQAASNSGLKKVLQSPAHFRYCEPSDDDTRGKRLGARSTAPSLSQKSSRLAM